MAPYNPPIAHYCHISVKHLSEDEIIKAIGKNGYFFKKITTDCGANYIWWNKELSIVEIWGPYNCMLLTAYNMRNHLKNIVNENYKYMYQPLPY
jgi:hypothetical protein